MKCPVCHDTRMREVEKDGILIDVCPDCKGVWLDRGELEKLMVGVREFRQEYDREVSDNNRYREQRPEQQRPVYTEGKRYDDDKYDKHGYPKHKKKKTMFDIFDDLF
ncbi:MAG: hypothetical protein K0R67_1799 [Paenibacillus sp.]|nr:hypothetical protein [Paenibacillus sp.]